MGRNRIARLVLTLVIGAAALLGSPGAFAPDPAWAAVMHQDGGERLGTTWESEYRSGGGSLWTDTWRRRGNTNVFDVTYVSGGIRDEYVHEVTLQGDRVTVKRLSGPYSYCTYAGTISGDGTTVTGKMTCSEEYTWRATITRAAAQPPPSVAQPPAASAPSGNIVLYGLSPNRSGVFQQQANGQWAQVGGPASDLFAGGNRMFATNPENGGIYRFTGSGWVKAGGPGKEFAVDGGSGAIFGISPDVSGVWEYHGDQQWTKVGGPAVHIFAGGGRLFATNPELGEINRYTGSGWVKAGGPGKTFAIDGKSGALFGISPDGGGVWQYQADEQWTKIGGPAERIFAGGGQLFATNPDNGDIYRYTGSGWVKAGGPGRDFVVACDGTIYGHSVGDEGIFRYQADQQWIHVGGAAAAMAVGCGRPS